MNINIIINRNININLTIDVMYTYIYIHMICTYKSHFSKEISIASGGTTSEFPHLGPSAAGRKCCVP